MGEKKLVNLLPLEVDSCDVEDYTLEPEDHEEPLWEGTVSDALSITAGLTKSQQSHSSSYMCRKTKRISEVMLGAEQWHGAFRLSFAFLLQFKSPVLTMLVVNPVENHK